jgi:hypothetical protein
MPTERMTAAEYRALLEKQEAATGNKHHAIGEFCDGYYFDSRKELKRYHELLLMQRAGLIKDLTVHPRFKVAAIDAVYEADFQYEENGAIVVEDVKSTHTRRLPLFKAKWAAAQKQYTGFEWRIYE